MSDIYIRTPEHEESRGPFGIPELQSLGEAEQINAETLYYDEEQEEWVPIGMNEDLNALVFPIAEPLNLKVRDTAPKKNRRRKSEPEDSGTNVDDILAAAEGESKDTKHLRRDEISAQRAAAIVTPGLGLIMLLSAAALLIPQFGVLSSALRESAFASLFSFPFMLVGLLDLVLGIMLFTSVTAVFPVIRVRMMLALGFGLYLCWAIGDPLLMALVAGLSVGAFTATLTRKYPVMIASLVLGLCASGFLVYLGVIGRFEQFFTTVGA